MASQLLDHGACIRVQSWFVTKSPPESIGIALDTPWPVATGQVSSGRVEVIAVGPSEWLFLAPASDEEALFKLLSDRFVASRFVATNLSSGFTRIRLTGEHVRELLSKACSIDVHPDVLLKGMAPRTRFAGMPVIVRCVEDSTFELIVTLGYRDHLLSWLADAEIEFSRTE
jgi:sarcosine oxidase subunit gamma